MQTALCQQLATQAVATKQFKKRAQASVVKAAERPYGTWYPNAETPEWLDGSMPGDFGFDPFGLSYFKERQAWLQHAELINGRWAMLGVAGVLAAELTGAADGFGNRWFEVGAKEYPFPLYSHLAVELAIFGCVENLRLQEYKKGNTTLFDPLNNADDFAMRTREVKNGRLAMIAFAGFFVQSVITLEGPLAGLKLHMADPFNYNITKNIGNISDAVLKYYPDQPVLEVAKNLA